MSTESELTLEQLVTEYVGYDNCGDEVCISYQAKLELLDKLQALIPRREQEAEVRAEGIGKYVAVSQLLPHIGYLLSHKAEGLPENTSRVIGELYADMKSIIEQNDKHMRTNPTSADIPTKTEN